MLEKIDTLLWFVALFLSIFYLIILLKTFWAKEYNTANIKLRIVMDFILCAIFIAKIILSLETSLNGIVGNYNFYLLIIWELSVVRDFFCLKITKEDCQKYGDDSEINDKSSIVDTQHNKETKNIKNK